MGIIFFSNLSKWKVLTSRTQAINQKFAVMKTNIGKKSYISESCNNIYKKFFHLYGNVDNSDYTLLTNILEQKFNLYFDSNRRCTTNNSIFIGEGSKGYFVADIGSNALKLHGLNAYRLLDRMFKAGEIYGNRPTTTTTTPPHTTKEKQKAAKPCNASLYPIEQNTTLFDHLTTKTGATLDTLQRYGVQAVYSSYNYQRPLSFAYVGHSNEGVKIKAPFNNKDNFKYSGDYSKDYLFGYSQLIAAQNVKAVIFVGGEDDAICINQHCNNLGIFALATKSESIYHVDAEKLAALKAITSRIFVLYDNDNKGIEHGAKFAKQYGFNLIDSALLYGVFDSEQKDVCDLYSNLGGAGVVNLVSVGVGLHSSMELDKEDNFSIYVKNVIECTFNQYLSEDIPFNLMTAALKKYRRLVVQSAAGTGKSYAVGKLSIWAQNNGYNGVIMFCPTQTITEQLHKSIGAIFAEHNEDTHENLTVAMLIGKRSKSSDAAAKEAALVACTFNQLASKSELINELINDNYLVVIDEYHQVTTDNSYRAGVCAFMLQLMQRAKDCILLSATPDFNILHPSFVPYGLGAYNGKKGYQLLRFYPTITNAIDFNILVHQTTKPILLGELDNEATVNGAHLIKLDNNGQLKAYCDLMELEGNRRPLHITSKRTDDQSAIAYKKIVENGGKDLKDKRICCTSKTESGASFCMDIGKVSILDTKCQKKGVQLATRPRLQSDGTNKLVKVNLYFDGKTEPTQKKGLQTTRINYLLSCAENNAKELNSNKGKHIAKESEYSGMFGVYQKGGTYEVDVLGILFELYKNEVASATPQLLKRRIERLDTRFNITISNFETTTDRLKDLLDAGKIEKELIVDKAKNLLMSDTMEFMKAKISQFKSLEAVTRAITLLNIPKPRAAHFIDFIANNDEVIGHSFSMELCNNTLRMVELGYSLYIASLQAFNLSSAEIDLIKHKHLTKKNIKTWWSAYGANDSIVNLTAVDSECTLIAILVRDKLDTMFDNISRGKRENKITAAQLATLVNSVISSDTKLKAIKPYSKKTVIPFIKTLFELEYKRSKKTSYYQLAGRVKI